MPFYNPIKHQIESVPLIIYPCTGLETVFDNKKRGCLENHVSELYKQNNLSNMGQYNILILWNDGEDAMTDVWIYSRLESWGSGPLVDAKIFKNFERETNIGISAGDGLVLLGLEEQHRWKTNSLGRYLRGSRPKLPSKISIGQSFYDIIAR